MRQMLKPIVLEDHSKPSVEAARGSTVATSPLFDIDR
jgi:hypothetical protein